MGAGTRRADIKNLCISHLPRHTLFTRQDSLQAIFLRSFQTHRACYYLQMGVTDPDRNIQSGLYGGMWCPDSNMLRKVRTAIVDNTEEFAEILSNKELQALFPNFDLGEKLKNVPRGFDKDHPFAEVLKLKDIGKYCPAGKEFFSRQDWVEETSRRFSLLKPLIDFLNYSLDE